MLLSGTRRRGSAEPWQLGLAQMASQRTRSASEAFGPVVHAHDRDVLVVQTSLAASQISGIR